MMTRKQAKIVAASELIGAVAAISNAKCALLIAGVTIEARSLQMLCNAVSRRRTSLLKAGYKVTKLINDPAADGERAARRDVAEVL